MPTTYGISPSGRIHRDPQPVPEKKETEPKKVVRRKRAVIRGDGMRFESVHKAAEAVYGTRTGITEACRGKRKLYLGYEWRYEDGE